MKKIILLLTFSLLLFSCGSRQKTFEENQSNKLSETSIDNSSEASVKIGRKDSELKVSDLTKTKISVIPKTGKCKDPQGSDIPSKPRTMTVKDEKGNETSIPVDENSEIHIENTTELETKLKSTETDLVQTQKEKTNLQARNEELKKELKSSLESNRPMWWLYILLFVSGVIFIPTIKFILKK